MLQLNAQTSHISVVDDEVYEQTPGASAAVIHQPPQEKQPQQVAEKNPQKVAEKNPPKAAEKNPQKKSEKKIEKSPQKSTEKNPHKNPQTSKRTSAFPPIDKSDKVTARNPNMTPKNTSNNAPPPVPTMLNRYDASVNNTSISIMPNVSDTAHLISPSYPNDSDKPNVSEINISSNNPNMNHPHPNKVSSVGSSGVSTVYPNNRPGQTLSHDSSYSRQDLVVGSTLCYITLPFGYVLMSCKPNMFQWQNQLCVPVFMFYVHGFFFKVKKELSL